ncbi:MAG TPA: hypothetical protein VEX36_09010 [Thermoleophilaceae bacterium]|nr:hypothetical protein [Thermoleophilaceae bacterium]
MNAESSPDVEALLRSALVPVEPSERMSDRLERSLSEITDFAVGELADWEIGAMRDPRNWGRPAAAVVVGGAAAGALVLVRARQQARRRQTAGLRALERGLRDVAADIQGRIDR